jgi:hypothetical protein
MLDIFDIREKLVSFEVVSTIIEKLIKRANAELAIKEIFFEETGPYTINIMVTSFNNTL